MLGGRGAGKTRLGAEWVRALVAGHAPYATRRHMHIALVGETEHDVREVMIEGPSGLLAVTPRAERPQWTATRRRLEWQNGAVAYAFSAEDPEQLRGPAVRRRLVRRARQMAPRRRDLRHAAVRPAPGRASAPARHHHAAADQADQAPARRPAHGGDARRDARQCAHLSPAFLDAVVGRYAGTRLGRQEIDGEVIEERADALWTRDAIEAARVAKAPALMRVVIGLDPPGSARAGADACGIVAAGISEAGTVYVLEDASVEGLAPERWAARAVALYRRHQADCLVAEVNFGGDMVRSGAAADRPQPAAAAGARDARQICCAPSRWRCSTRKAR